jgi:hypothetical protein
MLSAIWAIFLWIAMCGITEEKKEGSRGGEIQLNRQANARSPVL